MTNRRVAVIMGFILLISVSCLNLNSKNTPSLTPADGDQNIPTASEPDLSDKDIFQNDLFSFNIPSGWIIHEGTSVQGKNGWNYRNLNLNILVEIKGPQSIPNATIADRAIPSGSSLEDEYQSTYADPLPAINQINESQTTVDGLAGYTIHYNRPWGEPWYTFEETWFEKDGHIYVIACQFNLNHDDERYGCDAILQSFHFRNDQMTEESVVPKGKLYLNTVTVPPGGCPENLVKLVFAYDPLDLDSSHYGIYISDGDGGNPTRLPDQDAHYNTMPAWSPERCRVAFTSQTEETDHDIFIINADGTGLRQLTNDPARDMFPDWSFDGKTIAFVSYRDGYRNIYVMDSAGGPARQITFNGGDYTQWLAFSPVDDTVAYTFNPAGENVGGSIYLIHADGTGQIQLTIPPGRANDSEPAWSPDGKQIYFLSNRSAYVEIWVVNVDGSGVRQISNVTGAGVAIDHSLRVSPDGKYLIFYGAGSEGVEFSTDLFRLNIDGSGLINLTRSTGQEEWIDW